MRKEAATNLAAAFFNAMYWANQPRALNYRIGAIEGLSKALQEAFPDKTVIADVDRLPERPSFSD